MLRSTQAFLDSRTNYFRTVLGAPINKVKPNWLAPRRALRATPTANKERMSAIKNHEDQRVGLEWYYRRRQRKEYRHWPFVKMSDDNLRKHKDPNDAPSRSFSVKDEQCKSGKPLWNYYAETGRDYKTASTAHAHELAQFISLFTAKVWSKEQITASIKKLEEKTRFKTIADIASDSRTAVNVNSTHGIMPAGLMTHLVMCAKDVVLNNQRKAFRKKLHNTAVLRTRDMERYYALPYLNNAEHASVPKKTQPIGVFPEGDYLYGRAVKKYSHALHPTRYQDAYY